MADQINENQDTDSKASGYHMGEVDTVISVEDVNRQAKAMAEPVGEEKIARRQFPLLIEPHVF